MELDHFDLDADHILYDMTRLFRIRNNSFGTGVDRIDLAAAKQISDRFGDRVSYVVSVLGYPGLLSPQAATALMETLLNRWQKTDTANADTPNQMSNLAAYATLAKAVYRFSRSAAQWRQQPSRTAYLVCSHSGLPRSSQGLDRLVNATQAQVHAYIHDLIPITHPQYQKHGQDISMDHYVKRLASQNPRWIANSHFTADILAQHLENQGLASGQAEEPIAVMIPQLGLTPDDRTSQEEVATLWEKLGLDASRPCFVVLGTIEPRKNHLLLLNIWERMLQNADMTSVPQLLIIGGRGWENNAVFHLLDRSPAFQGSVFEANKLSDREVRAALTGTAALLFPSFIEGLGIPLMEAQALGTPVIASQIEVFEELATPGTTLIDPLDGPAWIEAIRSRASIATTVRLEESGQRSEYNKPPSV